MTPSDVLLASGSKRHAGLLAVCFFTHKALLFPPLPLPQERTWQTRPKERTTRPTPTRPSSTPRATTHTQKKRKNTSFRLQRELCHSRPPPSLISSLSMSSCSLWHPFSLLFFSLLPLTTAPPPSCQRGTCRRSTERFPKCLPIIATFIICISWPVFTSSVQPLQELSALIDFHVSRKRPEVCISASYALPSPKRILHPPQHISCLLSTRCLKIQTPLNFCQCLHVLCQLRCKMLHRWSKWGHFTALAHSFLLCITSDFFFYFFYLNENLYALYTPITLKTVLLGEASPPPWPLFPLNKLVFKQLTHCKISRRFCVTP